MGYEKLSGVLEEPLYARYRDQFPVADRLIYLNHAAVAPLCRPAATAMKALADDVCEYGSLHYDQWLETYAGLRQAAARLINAAPVEIAILKNTSEGIATVAEGLDWKSGDRLIAFEEEFPANYNPWHRLARRGVEVTWLSIYDPPDRIAANIRGARLLAISYVNYLSGYRIDLRQLGKLCHQHGCFFFVDAIQGLGAFPLDVEACHIDALAADGHKWMLGPEGNAFLYIREKWLDAVKPIEFGWTNTAHYADYSSRDMTLRPDAGRFECGTLNTAGCFGLKAAIEFLLEVGIRNIAEAVESRANQLATGLVQRGYELMIERTPERGSGIVTFRHPSINSHSIANDLKRNHVVVATRQNWIRMSPHFYISPEDINHVLELLPPV